jgi:hypothetical protein
MTDVAQFFLRDDLDSDLQTWSLKECILKKNFYELVKKSMVISLKVIARDNYQMGANA